MNELKKAIIKSLEIMREEESGSWYQFIDGLISDAEDAEKVLDLFEICWELIEEYRH